MDSEDQQRKSHETDDLFDASGLEGADTEVATVLDDEAVSPTLQPGQDRHDRKQRKEGVGA